jgi:hypothetical protein
MPILAPLSVSLRTAMLCGPPHPCRMLREIALRYAPRAVAPLAVIAGACNGGDLALPSDPDTEQLVMIDGNEQEGSPGERLPEALIVRLLDQAGAGIADRDVSWVVSAGDGELEPTATTTDADGFATARWTLGPEAGTNTVDAVVSHVGLVTFTATATEGGALALTIEPIEGDGQTAPAGSAVPLDPAVRVLEGGEPVAGVEVTFAVAAGGGTVQGPTQTTNDEGIARVGEWVLGVEPGLNRLEASAEAASGSPVVFTAEGTASSGVDRMVFAVQPPDDVDARERFRVEVALLDEDGDLVPLTGIVVYLGLFREGSDVPSNSLVLGDRFRATEGGVAVFDDLGVTQRGRYRLRALTDDLPEHGPGGPQPALFSDQFEVD